MGSPTHGAIAVQSDVTPELVVRRFYNQMDSRKCEGFIFFVFLFPRASELRTYLLGVWHPSFCQFIFVGVGWSQKVWAHSLAGRDAQQSASAIARLEC